MTAVASFQTVFIFCKWPLARKHLVADKQPAVCKDSEPACEENFPGLNV